jgi:hypothetical protein
MTKYNVYSEIMEAAADAMIESARIMNDASLPFTHEQRAKLVEKLQKRAIDLKELAEKMGSDGLEYDAPSE